MRARPKTETIKVRVSAELGAAIRQAAAEDEQGDGAWLRILAIAVLKRRRKWPPPETMASPARG